MSLDAVVKIGGRLGRSPALVPLCREVSRLGKTYSILVVPGGGVFADQVREADRLFDLGNTSAHCMALLAMDQYGYMLNRLVGESSLSADLDAACASAASGRPAILLPSALVMREDPLPHSWQVTSDSIAAWVSQRCGCRRLILLKDVDGLFVGDRLVSEMTPGRLAEHRGGVDEFLAVLLKSVSMKTWVINGLHPDRLSELLETGHTIGTRITPDFESLRLRG
jgi:5-(aminomethyl)-3-furanmethanol phosphate kinase